MTILTQLLTSLFTTLRDMVPITAVILFFQLVVIRRPITDLRRVVLGFGMVIVGLAMFLVGLELALFPVGTAMAMQLAAPSFVDPQSGDAAILAAELPWYRYYWTYLFAITIGFSATIAEPALLAVAMKAHEVSGGTLQVWPLRIAVALGAGIGVMLGTVRIVSGIPLPWMILGGYILVISQTCFAPRQIIPLAYDSGGVTTSTVTVPLVAALGLGLASGIPGRSPLEDGFGMIAITVLCPMVTVMGYAQLAHYWNRRRSE